MHFVLFTLSLVCSVVNGGKDYCANQGAPSSKNSSDMKSSYEHIRFYTTRAGHASLSETMAVSYDGGLYVAGEKMVTESEHRRVVSELRSQLQPPSCTTPGGKYLQFNGTNWLCICEEGYYGNSCTIYLPDAITRYTFDSSSEPGADLTGNGNAATLQGAKRTERGTLLIEEEGDHLIVPQTAWLGDNDEWTFTCWVKPNCANPSYGIWVYFEHHLSRGWHKNTLEVLFSSGNTSFSGIFDNWYGPGSDPIELAPQYSATRVQKLVEDFASSSWTHLTWVKETKQSLSIIKLYVNGELAATEDFEPYSSDAPEIGVIGGYRSYYISGSSAQYFYGELDDIIIFFQALDSQQIEYISSL